MRSSMTDTIKQSRRQAELDQYAWRNRRAMTASEAALWAELRRGNLGVAFRRQVPLCGRYIVDFCAPAVRLVVEVDGRYHALRGRADAQRDRELARCGYHVLRISAEVVMRDLRAAVERVSCLLERRVARTPLDLERVATTNGHSTSGACGAGSGSGGGGGGAC
jgi:very-short-patch-repair endonuclease